MSSFLRASFAGDMLVLTRERGAVRWDDLHVNEEVWSQDEFDPKAPGAWKRVEEIFSTEAIVCTLRVAEQEIKTTAEHPFWVEGKGWTAVQELQVGERVLSEVGAWLRIESLRDTQTYAVVYNFRVAGAHTYFVGCPEWGFSVWVHNTYGAARNAAKEIKISKIAPDYLRKGVHIHVGGIEVRVLPGKSGAVVFKPVFSSQAKQAHAAIEKAKLALNDSVFRKKLQEATERALQFARQSDLPGAAGKAAEFHFLRIALGRLQT